MYTQYSKAKCLQHVEAPLEHHVLPNGRDFEIEHQASHESPCDLMLLDTGKMQCMHASVVDCQKTCVNMAERSPGEKSPALTNCMQQRFMQCHNIQTAKVMLNVLVCLHSTTDITSQLQVTEASHWRCCLPEAIIDEVSFDHTWRVSFCSVSHDLHLQSLETGGSA